MNALEKQQSKNLMTLSKIGDHIIKPEPHNSLNYSQGIIRDRDMDLVHIEEDDICEEIGPSGGCFMLKDS